LPGGFLQFGFDAAGEAQQTAVIEASPDRRNRAPLPTNVPDGSLLYFSDPAGWDTCGTAFALGGRRSGRRVWRSSASAPRPSPPGSHGGGEGVVAKLAFSLKTAGSLGSHRRGEAGQFAD